MAIWVQVRFSYFTSSCGNGGLVASIFILFNGCEDVFLTGVTSRDARLIYAWSQVSLILYESGPGACLNGL
jgi:hypothetical protein